MPRRATSLAVFKTARFNPIHREEETALAYIEKLEAQGFSFKEIVTDAINRAAGATPEMFSREVAYDSSRFVGLVEQVFGNFRDELLEKIGSGAVRIAPTAAEDERRDDGISAFAKNFQRGLMERQEMLHGEDEE